MFGTDSSKGPKAFSAWRTPPPGTSRGHPSSRRHRIEALGIGNRLRNNRSSVEIVTTPDTYMLAIPSARFPNIPAGAGAGRSGRPSCAGVPAPSIGGVPPRDRIARKLITALVQFNTLVVCTQCQTTFGASSSVLFKSAMSSWFAFAFQPLAQTPMTYWESVTTSVFSMGRSRARTP